MQTYRSSYIHSYTSTYIRSIILTRNTLPLSVSSCLHLSASFHLSPFSLSSSQSLSLTPCLSLLFPLSFPPFPSLPHFPSLPPPLPFFLSIFHSIFLPPSLLPLSLSPFPPSLFFPPCILHLFCPTAMDILSQSYSLCHFLFLYLPLPLYSSLPPSSSSSLLPPLSHSSHPLFFPSSYMHSLSIVLSNTLPIQRWQPLTELNLIHPARSF